MQDTLGKRQQKNSQRAGKTNNKRSYKTRDRKETSVRRLHEERDRGRCQSATTTTTTATRQPATEKDGIVLLLAAAVTTRRGGTPPSKTNANQLVAVELTFRRRNPALVLYFTRPALCTDTVIFIDATPIYAERLKRSRRFFFPCVDERKRAAELLARHKFIVNGFGTGRTKGRHTRGIS